MSKPSLVVHGRWVIPIETEETAGNILEHHAVVVGDDGRILAVAPSAAVDADEQYSRCTVVRRDDRHVLMPGFVNAHTHAAMTLLRGYAEDVDLMTWLTKYIWPAEQKHVDEQFVRDGTELAIEEMVRSGVCTFNDMYFYPEETARICSRLGMRVTVGIPIMNFPCRWSSGPAESIVKGEQLIAEFRGNPLVSVAWTPHSAYALDDDGLKKVKELADKHNTLVHTHMHESPSELDSHEEQHKCRPFDRFQKAGLIGPRLLAAHCTQVTDQEAEQLTAAGVALAHCPCSNMKLGSGSFAMQQWLALGVTVGLGTDGAASNDALDMLSELKTAALLDKHVCQGSVGVPAARLLAVATLGGARALGLADSTGSLTVGKWADFIAIPLDTVPIFHPISALVYGSNRCSDVWVAGRCLLKESVSTVLDPVALRKKAEKWQHVISKDSHHEKK